MSATVSVPELAQMVRQSNCCLIDVREPVEFAEEHISMARTIPLGELSDRAGEIGRDLPIVVMCLGGKRSGEAQAQLARMGFQDVRSLEGGLLAWKSAGLHLERSSRVGLPLMRQVQLLIGLGTLAGALLALLANPLFALVPAFLGAGLAMAGATGWCGLAILLSKMPWNRAAPVPPPNDAKQQCCQ